MALSFFYHSPLGALYFVILASVCLLAIWRGGKDYRLFGFCVLAVFLADRTLLATISNENVMIGLGAVAEFAALMAIVAFAERTKAAGAIGFLFLAKMLVYLGLLFGYISFSTMASWTELFGYFQIGVIGGGSLGGVRGKRSGYSNHSAGRAGIFSITKSWLSPKQHS